MTTHINENGAPFDLFAEVEEEFKDYLCPELVDGVVYLCLPVAMRYGHDIVSDIPVSEQSLHNINTVLIPSLVMGDD